MPNISGVSRDSRFPSSSVWEIRGIVGHRLRVSSRVLGRTSSTGLPQRAYVLIAAAPTPVTTSPASTQSPITMEAEPPARQFIRAPPAAPAALFVRAPVPEPIAAPASARILTPPSKPVAPTDPRIDHEEKLEGGLGYSILDLETLINIHILATRQGVGEQYGFSRESPNPPGAPGSTE